MTLLNRLRTRQTRGALLLVAFATVLSSVVMRKGGATPAIESAATVESTPALPTTTAPDADRARGVPDVGGGAPTPDLHSTAESFAADTSIAHDDAEIEAASDDDDDDDPYAYNEPITTVPDSAAMRSSNEAAATAAPDESQAEPVESTAEPLQGPVIAASGPPLPPSHGERSAQPARQPVRTTAAGACAAAADAPMQWSDLPANERATFPMPRAVAVVYTRRPTQRFVVVDDARFHEGDALPNGVRLVAVGPSTLVLSTGRCVVEVPLRIAQR